MRKIEVKVAPCRASVLRRRRRALRQALCWRQVRPSPPDPAGTDDRVVQPKEALPEIEIEQEREIEQPAQQVFGFKVLKTAGRRPEARGNADRDVRVLGKNRQFPKARALRLGQEVEADADRARDCLGAIGRRGVEDDEALASSRLFAPATASGSGSSPLTTRSRRKPLTIFRSCAHSPSRAASLARFARSRAGLSAGRPAEIRLSASPACMASTG